jgi:hypothetical protein
MRNLPKLLLWAAFLALTACSGQATGQSDTGSPVANPSQADTLPKTELAQFYTQAIAAYIRAVYQIDQTRFDTLYFGKHVYGQPDDFPDIELPKSIENTEIRLVSPEAGTKIQQERNSRYYINMMGWVEPQHSAEFILITFSKGMAHQFDGHLKYQYNANTKGFDLAQMRFEYFSPAGKVDRVLRYLNGKFVQD